MNLLRHISHRLKGRELAPAHNAVRIISKFHNDIVNRGLHIGRHSVIDALQICAYLIELRQNGVPDVRQFIDKIDALSDQLEVLLYIFVLFLYYYLQQID